MLAISKQVRSESHFEGSLRKMSIFDPVKTKRPGEDDTSNSINEFMLRERKETTNEKQ